MTYVTPWRSFWPIRTVPPELDSWPPEEPEDLRVALRARWLEQDDKHGDSPQSPWGRWWEEWDKWERREQVRSIQQLPKAPGSIAPSSSHLLKAFSFFNRFGPVMKDKNKHASSFEDLKVLQSESSSIQNSASYWVSMRWRFAAHFWCSVFEVEKRTVEEDHEEGWLSIL